MRNGVITALPPLRSWHWDTIVAVGTAAGVLVGEAVAGGSLATDWAALIVVVVSAGAVAVRRRWPLWAAVALAAALILARAVGEIDPINGVGPTLLEWVPVDLAYGLGVSAGVWTGLLGVAVLTVGAQSTDLAFNPLFEMVTFGPWFAGRVVRARRRLNAEIAERNRELEAERARFAQESVRYERARIARDLHDIVAHCVSVMVVQAGAAQRVGSSSDVDAAADALDCIAEAAAEARTELGQLVDMLGGTSRSAPPEMLSIDDLVQRATATGLTVRYQPSSCAERLSRPMSEAAYRVVQESLTNAIKHAPGVPVDIAVREAGDQIEVEVITAAAVGRSSGLEHSGAGRGLAGLGARVDASGGTFSAGPTTGGGWRVHALLPI